MKEKLTPKLVALLALVTLIVVALAGWFMAVSPQRSTAATLDAQIADAEASLQAAQYEAGLKPTSKLNARTSRRLARGLPDRTAMPKVLRELLFAARSSRVTLDSVTPQPLMTTSQGYDAVPIDVVVTGRYGGIQRFLHKLRLQAGISGERVHASGRLFTVDTLSLAAAEATLPRITATLRVNAFVYKYSPPAATSPAVGSSPGSLEATEGTP